MELRRTDRSVTYKAEDSLEAREVAVEVVPIASLRHAVVRQLDAEAVSAKQLNQINIPVLHEFGVDRDELIYVTEYFDGTTAEEWVRSHGALPTGTMLRIAAQVVNALAAAAFQNIFHHAVNPRNLMLVPGQTPQGDWPLIKVVNFIGLTPAPTSANAAALDPVNPVHFASPEQRESGTVDFRSEIYSLGSTLWFLLTGLPAAGAASVEAGNLFAPVKRLLVKMLAADPAQRPLDPLALQEEIQDCIAHLDRLQSVASKFGLAAPLASAPIAAAPAAPRVRRQWPTKQLALAALLLLLVGLSAVMLPARFRNTQGSNTRDEDTIGVPVGVPESSAPAVASNATEIPRDETASQTQSPAAIVSADSPVLTSTVEAPVNEGDTSSEVNEQPAQVAENRTPLQPENAEPGPSVSAAGTPAPVVAKNARLLAQAAEPEPEPPSEGPNDVAESAPPPPQVAETGVPGPSESEAAMSRLAMSSSIEPARDESRPISPPVAKKKDVTVADARAPKPGKSALAKSRVAANSQPPVPRGSVRAQFLGTTSDGNLVFGLPGAEKGYVAPDAPRERSSRRRVRRAQAVEELPVLPALPPDR